MLKNSLYFQAFASHFMTITLRKEMILGNPFGRLVIFYAKILISEFNE